MHMMALFVFLKMMYLMSIPFAWVCCLNASIFCTLINGQVTNEPEVIKEFLSLDSDPPTPQGPFSPHPSTLQTSEVKLYLRNFSV